MEKYNGRGFYNLRKTSMSIYSQADLDPELIKNIWSNHSTSAKGSYLTGSGIIVPPSETTFKWT